MVVNPIDTSLAISRTYGGSTGPATMIAPLATYNRFNANAEAVTEVAPVTPAVRINDYPGRFIDRYA